MVLSLLSCVVKQFENQKDNMNKSIVVFFSHAGDNYSVGNIKEGNTKIVADIIKESTGADHLEIVSVKDYNLGYNDLCTLAKTEQQKGELPGYTLLLNGKPVASPFDFAVYDTIYIGGPVWWGTYPQVMFTFFKDHSLSGKTILPFTTHEGSALGSCVSDLKKTCPQATFGKALSIYGHEVRSDAGKKKVMDWVM